MKIDLKTILIGSLSVVIIFFVMRECSEPAEQREEEREKLFKTNIAILEADKKEIQAAQDSIGKVFVQRTRKDSLAIKRQESVIQALERKAAIQRTPLVDALVQDNPELLAFVTTQQEIISELKVEIDTLKSQAQFQRKLNEDLIIAEFMEDRIEQQMALEQTRRIDELDKAAKKKGRGNRLWKGLATVLAGAVLVETVLLIAD